MDTKKLRQKILDLAIRGKLVPQDPNDEPASVLLWRIRAEKERLIKEGKIKRSKKSASDDEIEAPFEIPESWEWVRLEDMVSPDCTLGYGIVQPMEDVLNGEIAPSYLASYKRDPMSDGDVIFDFSHFEVNTETEPDENYRSLYIYFEYTGSAS